VAVMSFVLLSLKVPVALNCWVAPRGMLALGGLIEIDVKLVAGVAVLLLPPPHPPNSPSTNNPRTVRATNLTWRRIHPSLRDEVWRTGVGLPLVSIVRRSN